MRIKYLLIYLCLMSSQAAAVISDEVVISVGDHVITRSEFEQEKLLFQQSSQAQSLSAEQETQFIQWFVDLQVQLAFGRQMHIELDDKEVNKIEQQLLRQNGLQSLHELEEKIVQSGVDFSLFMQNVRRQFLLNKISEMALYHRVKVSDGKLDSLYAQEIQRHRVLYVEDIAFNTESADAPKRERLLRQAQDVAKSWKQKAYYARTVPKPSRMISFKWDGLLDFPNEFQQSLMQMQVGDVSDPIQTGNGYHVLKLIKSKLPDGFKLDKEQIRQKLMADNMAVEMPKWIGELKEQMHVDIHLD